jgi:hypothetical protein
MKETGVIQKREVTSGETGGKEWQRISVTVNNKHFSSFNAADALINEGDTVEIEYDIKGKYNNIKTMKVVEAGKTLQTGGDYKQPLSGTESKKIARMNALTNSNALLANLISANPELAKKIFVEDKYVDLLINMASVLTTFICEEE